MTDVGASMAARVEGVVIAPNGIAGDITSQSTPVGWLGIGSTSEGVERAAELGEIWYVGRVAGRTASP
jgi:alkanesulfonate monooxygenase SsuD/methylene tetrahydromethanopterin reductase-like flavin-dependent oxidoreductase (luciferase family)